MVLSHRWGFLSSFFLCPLLFSGVLENEQKPKRDERKGKDGDHAQNVLHVSSPLVGYSTGCFACLLKTTGDLMNLKKPTGYKRQRDQEKRESGHGVVLPLSDEGSIQKRRHGVQLFFALLLEH